MDKLNLTCKPLLNGIMAYWNAQSDAANYIITLFVGEQPISVRTNPRTELYCSFSGLAKLSVDYKLKVEAEDRNGKIIAEGVATCDVSDFVDEMNKIKYDICSSASCAL